MRKKTTLLLIFVAAIGSTTFGSGFLGTTTSNLDKGQFSLGFEYLYSSQDPDSIYMKRRTDEFFNGTLLDLSTADGFMLKRKDFELNRYYMVSSFGIDESWEVYLKLGLADVKGKDKAEDGWVGHNFDNDFALGWGTKYTFLEEDNVDWGVSFQMNWLNTNWGKTTSPVSSEVYRHDLKLQTFDMLIAVGPTIDMGGWSLYGGPFYQHVSGEYEDTKIESTTFMGDIIARRQESKGDFKTDELGGFLGVQIDLTKNSSLNIEASAYDSGWALGASITYRF